MRSSSRVGLVMRVLAVHAALVASAGRDAFAVPAPPSIRLAVDAREAPRRVLHVRLSLPATPGPFALTYPEWIPGNHTPASAINDVVGMHVLAGSRELAWRRDPLDMFTLRIDVPAGVSRIEVSFDVAMPSESNIYAGSLSLADQLALLDWNPVAFYPANAAPDSLRYDATLTLPAGWKHATSLPLQSQSGGELRFAPVSLTTLIDSPVLAGAHMRSIPLTPPNDPRPVTLDLACDSEVGLGIKPEHIARMKRLVAEADALFGARHFRQYHFLHTLSEHVDHFGLEHHECNDSRSDERMWIDDDARLMDVGLLTHEFVHSWNGKYRRPRGLATHDYRQPMTGELLWVYEGLTEYLGWVMAARSGLETAEESREELARVAAQLDATPGRAWRPLIDTAISVRLLDQAPREWRLWRRSEDYYGEGQLIWLEADVLIRQRTNGARSLDDFCRAFFGGASGPPAVVPYDLDDLLVALNRVCPNDWREFFAKRIDVVTRHAPFGGIENGGWRMAWADTSTGYFGAAEREYDRIDLFYTIGARLDSKSGAFIDVLPGTTAAAAGLAPGMKLVAVDGRKWSKDVLLDALRAGAKAKRPVELLAENDEFIRTYRVTAPSGLRYPAFARTDARPDLLGKVLAPRTKP
jgi:predicted metalloprotease with PDZ domain